MNRLTEVTPLVEDALAARELAVEPATPAWRMLCRISLIVASRAHAINARREWGNYEDSWPQAAEIPAAELSGTNHSIEMAASHSVPESRLTPDPSSFAPVVGPLISESFAALVEARAGWGKDYRDHVQQTLVLFMSLIGDVPVRQITGEVAEVFRNRLKGLPTKRGKGIYAGMSPFQTLQAADRLRAALHESGETIPWGKINLPRERAQ